MKIDVEFRASRENCARSNKERLARMLKAGEPGGPFCWPELDHARSVRLLADTDLQFSEIVTAQQTYEGTRCIFEAVDNVFPILQVSIAH